MMVIIIIIIIIIIIHKKEISIIKYNIQYMTKCSRNIAST